MKHLNDFTEWRMRNLHIGQNFVEDGIIDVVAWNDTKTKILFLAKEAYGSEFDLRKKLRDEGPFDSWYTVVDWTFAITEVLEKKEIPDYRPPIFNVKPVQLIWNAWLRKIAVVNVKKSNGKSSSENINLKTYVEADKDLLRAQIDFINPDVILCCNTYEPGFYNIIYGTQKFTYDYTNVSEWCMHHKVGDKTRLVIDFWHFANQSHNKVMYFALCGVLMKYQMTRRNQ